MKRGLFLIVLFGIARPAPAHFVFVLPGSASGEVQVVFNDRLDVDVRISGERLALTQLTTVTAQGGRSPLKWSQEEHSLKATIPEPRPVLVGGATTYGYARSSHTGDKPVLVKYYSKAILGPLGAAVGLRLGDEARYEIVPESVEGRFRLRVLRGSEPVAGARFSSLTAAGNPPGRGVTDKVGLIQESFEKPGRYGVWVKIIEPTPGEWEGKPYDEVHHFATLVMDVSETHP